MSHGSETKVLRVARALTQIRVGALMHRAFASLPAHVAQTGAGAPRNISETNNR